MKYGQILFSDAANFYIAFIITRPSETFMPVIFSRLESAMQTLIQSAAQDLRFKKQQAIAAYRHHRQPMVFFDAYGRAIETALGALWLEIFGAGRLCLLATGGFGRDEMYPYSDLDLAIVSPEPLDELEQEQIALFVQSKILDRKSVV